MDFDRNPDSYAATRKYKAAEQCKRIPFTVEHKDTLHYRWKKIKPVKGMKIAAIIGLIIGFGIGMLGNSVVILVFLSILGLICGATVVAVPVAIINNLTKNIYKKADMDIERYTKEFEDKAKDMSAKYAQSSKVKEIVSLMTQDFSRLIMSADRHCSVEMVKFDFKIYVFRDKIRYSTNPTPYDFKTERCENLNSQLERSAMSYALASLVVQNINNMYYRDPSGAEFTVSIDLGYNVEADYCIIYHDEGYANYAKITYKATNAKYKNTEKW